MKLRGYPRYMTLVVQREPILLRRIGQCTSTPHVLLRSACVHDVVGTPNAPHHNHVKHHMSIPVLLIDYMFITEYGRTEHEDSLVPSLVVVDSDTGYTSSSIVQKTV